MEQLIATVSSHLAPIGSICPEENSSLPIYFERQAFAIGNNIREALDAVYGRSGQYRPAFRAASAESWTIRALIEQELAEYLGPAGVYKCSLAAKALLQEIEVNHYFCPSTAP